MKFPVTIRFAEPSSEKYRESEPSDNRAPADGFKKFDPDATVDVMSPDAESVVVSAPPANVLAPPKDCAPVDTSPGWVASAGCMVMVDPDAEAPFASGDEPKAPTETEPLPPVTVAGLIT
jgi:hypothetical protein